MNCNDMKRAVELWESGNALNVTDIEGMRLHAGSCDKCSGFAGLFPFIMRDSATATRPSSGGIEIPEGYGERVMSRIRSEAPVRRKAALLGPVLAFAASLVIVIGITAGMLIGQNAGSGEIIVRLVLDAPDAQNVSVAGDFSDWNAQPLKIVTKNNTSLWEIDLRLKKGNVYKYNFIVDGDKWIIDPNAPVRVGDGFGGQNSVISI